MRVAIYARVSTEDKGQDPENQLRELRHRVAHGSLDSGDFLLLDESEDRELVVKWLPFMRCAARRRMKNDFDAFLRYLGEDGVVVSDADE